MRLAADEALTVHAHCVKPTCAEHAENDPLGAWSLPRRAKAGGIQSFGVSSYVGAAPKSTKKGLALLPTFPSSAVSADTSITLFRASPSPIEPSRHVTHHNITWLWFMSEDCLAFIRCSVMGWPSRRAASVPLVGLSFVLFLVLCPVAGRGRVLSERGPKAGVQLRMQYLCECDVMGLGIPGGFSAGTGLSGDEIRRWRGKMRQAEPIPLVLELPCSSSPWVSFSHTALASGRRDTRCLGIAIQPEPAGYGGGMTCSPNPSPLGRS